MKKLPIIASYSLAMVLGTYLNRQFIFNEPIEIHRWIITSGLFIFMISRIRYETKY
jgi:hypothetical protein